MSLLTEEYIIVLTVTLNKSDLTTLNIEVKLTYIWTRSPVNDDLV